MKVNQLKAGAALSYISMGLGYLVSIIYTPIMLRLLGQSEYGLYNLVASVVAYLGVLNFGFGSAYMRYYSRYKVKDDREKIATLNGMFFIIFAAIGLVAVIAGSVLALNTELIFGSELTSFELAKAKVLMFILVVNLAVSFPNIVFTSHITANERFIFQRVVQMIKTVVNPFVILPVLIMGYGSVGMVVITTILNISIEAINATYCLRKLKMEFAFRHFDFRLMKEMTVFSSFVFINLIIDQINWNVDKFVLGRFHGTISVAAYGLAAQLNHYYLTIATTISSVFIPRVHRVVAKSDNNDELTKLFTKIGRVQFIMLSLIASGLIFFGKPFINLWAGPEYSDSYLIAVILISTGTFSLIQSIGIEIQRAKNMHRFRSWLYLIIAMCNLGVTIPLARHFEGIGAAIGTSGAILLGNVLIMNWYYHKYVGISIEYFWKGIAKFVPALIAPIVTGIVLNSKFHPQNVTSLIVVILIYTIIFTASFWMLGMNQYERELITKPIRRLVRR